MGDSPWGLKESDTAELLTKGCCQGVSRSGGVAGSALRLGGMAGCAPCLSKASGLAQQLGRGAGWLFCWGGLQAGLHRSGVQRLGSGMPGVLCRILGGVAPEPLRSCWLASCPGGTIVGAPGRPRFSG